jgi:Flavin reductase like domain
MPTFGLTSEDTDKADQIVELLLDTGALRQPIGTRPSTNSSPCSTMRCSSSPLPRARSAPAASLASAPRRASIPHAFSSASRTPTGPIVKAVHVLSADAAPLAALFGGRSGDEADKFAKCDWRPGPSNVPILGDCDTWFVGRIVDRFAAGDHDAFLLEPLEAAAGARRRVFRLDQAKGIEAGHPA